MPDDAWPEIHRRVAAELGEQATLAVGNWEIIAFDSHQDGRAEARVDRSALVARVAASTAPSAPCIGW